MSYLAQVIASAGEAEMTDLRKKCTEIEKRVNCLDEEVKEYLESSYVRFTVQPQETHLSIKATELMVELDQSINRINTHVKRELGDSVEESKKLFVRLNETNAGLRTLKQLLDIDNIVRAAEEEQNRGSYLEASKKFKHLKEILALDASIGNEIIYEPLADYILSLHTQFLYENLAIWNEFITWNERTLPNGSKKITLTINNVDGKSDVIRVLLYYDYLDFEVKLLNDKLFKKLLEPLMNYEKYTTNLKVYSNDGIAEITIELREENNSRNFECLKTIDNLTEVFATLFESLDVFISEDETFVNKLAELQESEFCDCFIKCVYEAIPVIKENLFNLEEMLQAVYTFDTFLKDNGFLKSSNTVILDYIKDRNNLFIQKKCQEFLVEARKICRQDLHETIEISPNVTEPNFDLSDITMCKNMWEQPACSISKSTEQLLNLIKRGLMEITCENEVNDNIRIFHTVRGIIGMYLDLTPLIHEDLLKTVPQQAALFYNNCMYLAHELALLSIQIVNLLPDHIVSTFMDFVEPLRIQAYNVLDHQTVIQKQGLLEILAKSGLSSLNENAEFPALVEDSLTECMKQLLILQRLWQNILPKSMYSKYIGFLCNAFMEQLIETVIHVKKLTAHFASQLAVIFGNIRDKISLFFQDSKEMTKNVKLLSKFEELILILRGNEKNINQWTDGKEMLFREFLPDQIKHLMQRESE